jgi:tetratricopeptide (TPR) repeat protein
VCEGRDDTAAISTYLHRGRVLRLAGRLNEASASYAAAGDLALWQGDTHSELLSRIGRGIVLQKLGNLPAAARLFTDVLADARRGGDQDAQARASHDLAVTLHRQNRTAQAVGFAFQAYRLYEERENKQRALSDVGMILQALGHYSAARDAYELVLAQDIPVGMRINTKLELLELEAVTQNRVAFERRRRELAMIGAELPPDAQVDFEIKLGGGLASFGERRQARRHLQKAVQHAEEYRLNDYLFRAETALRELDNDHDSATPPAPAEVPAWDEHYPEVGAVAEQLHALRAGG